MKKLTIFILTVALLLSALFCIGIFAADAANTAVSMTGGEKLYLQPNAAWLQDHPRFAVYLIGDTPTWVSMTDSDGDDIYEAEVPAGSFYGLIFCRMNPYASNNSWDSKWNQTAQLSYDGTNDLFTLMDDMSDPAGGTWALFCDHGGNTNKPTANDKDTHSFICSVCGATSTPEAHSGGTATCKEQAKCEHCGETYGAPHSLPPHDFSGTAHDGSAQCRVCGKTEQHYTELGAGQSFTDAGNTHVTVIHTVINSAALRRDSATVTFSGGFLTESVTLGLYNGKLVAPNGFFGTQNTIGYIDGQIVGNQLHFRYAFPCASVEHPAGEKVTLNYTIRFADEDGQVQEVSDYFTLQYINYEMGVDLTEYGATLNLTFYSVQGNVIKTNVYNAGTHTVSISDYYGGLKEYQYIVDSSRDPYTQVTREDMANGTVIRLQRTDPTRILITLPEGTTGVVVEGNGTPLVTVTVTSSVRFCYSYMDHNADEYVYYISVDRPAVIEQDFSLDRLGYTTVDFEDEREYALATDGVTKYRNGNVTVYLTNCVFKATGKMVCFTFTPDSAATHTFSKEEIVLIENGAEVALTEDVTVSLGAVLVNDHVFLPATCTAVKTCRYCGDTEGESLGHDMGAATCTTPSTCTVCGHTEGKALGHNMADATCTTPSTCTVCGHTEGEVLAHTYDNACDADCNACNEARTVGEHLDSDGNSLCDHCAAELPKEGFPVGAIVGIVIGSVVIVGIGGFCVFWFVIKKRKWGDLVSIFKKK